MFNMHTQLDSYVHQYTVRSSFTQSRSDLPSSYTPREALNESLHPFLMLLKQTCSPDDDTPVLITLVLIKVQHLFLPEPARRVFSPVCSIGVGFNQRSQEDEGSYLSHSANTCAILQLCYCILKHGSFSNSWWCGGPDNRGGILVSGARLQTLKQRACVSISTC